MNLLAHINAADARRDKHFCPCCKSRMTEDEMDLTGEYADLKAVKAKYHAPICWLCAEAHVLTADGVLMLTKDAVRSDDLDAWFSDEDALWQAEADASADAADRRMMRGWR